MQAGSRVGRWNRSSPCFTPIGSGFMVSSFRRYPQTMPSIFSSTSLAGSRMLESVSRFSRTFATTISSTRRRTGGVKVLHGTEKLPSEADDIRLNVIVTPPGDELCRPYWAKAVVVAEVRFDNG